MSTFIEDLSEKTALVDNDLGVIADSASSNQNKKFKFSSLWTFIKNKMFMTSSTKSSFTNATWYRVASIPPNVPVNFEFELIGTDLYIKGLIACSADNGHPAAIFLKTRKASTAFVLLRLRFQKVPDGTRYLEVYASSTSTAQSYYFKFNSIETNLTILNWIQTSVYGTVLVDFYFNMETYNNPNSGIWVAGKIHQYYVDTNGQTTGGTFALESHNHDYLYMPSGNLSIMDYDDMITILRLVDDSFGATLQSILSSNLDLGGSDDNTCSLKNRSILWQGSGNTSQGKKLHIIGDGNTIDSDSEKLRLTGDANTITNSTMIDAVGTELLVTNTLYSQVSGYLNDVNTCNSVEVSGKNHKVSNKHSVKVHGNGAVVTMNSGRAFNHDNANYLTANQQYQLSLVNDIVLSGINNQQLPILIPDNSPATHLSVINATEIFALDIKAVAILSNDLGEIIESTSFHCSGIVDMGDQLFKFTNLDQISSLSSMPFFHPDYVRLEIVDFNSNNFKLALVLFNVAGFQANTGLVLTNWTVRANFWVDFTELPTITGNRDYLKK